MLELKEVRDLIKQEKAELRTAQTLTDMKHEKIRYDYMIQGLSRLEERLDAMETGEKAGPVSEP